MFKLGALSKILAGVTTVSGAATTVSIIHDYKVSKLGKIEEDEVLDTSSDIEEIGDIEDIGSDTADEIMNEV